MLSTLFVFDIETIPDTDAAPNLTGFTDPDITARRDELTRYHLEITDGKNAFLRQPFHKIVAISFLEAEIHRENNEEFYILRDIRSGGTIDASEKDLVTGFFKYLEKHKPRLVSFNGRTFDLPVLKYRAMVHGVQAKWLFQAGDKWNSYNSRYSLDWHCDLIDSLSDFGASAKVKLNEVCSVFGFPGKVGVDGSQVSGMYDNGELAAIRHYCETDVINTYLVYLRQMQHRGSLSTENYNNAIEETISFLKNHAEERPYFAEFLEAWAGACGEKFYL
jgi:predicted PolB exonuclease-like 3'-5' exonuclease